MKKYSGYLIMAGVMTGFALQAEVVITSPTGVQDESDVVLEKVVDSVKDIPADAVAVIGDTVSFVADEIRNTTHGVTSAFKSEPPRTSVAANLLMDVEQAWNEAGRIQMKTFTVRDAIAKEISGSIESGGAKVDARSFFQPVEFPEGCSADYWPKFNRLVVRQTATGMLKVVDLLAEHQEKPDYRQIEIETKFIEVEQKTLDELGFDWDFSDTWNIEGDTTIDLVNQTLSDTLRTAAQAFYGAGPAGTLTLTKEGWIPLELAISALEQSAGTDVLSAPSVTTTDGTTAEIWVGDRELMPTKFSPGSQGTSVYLEYDGWTEKNIGVHLEVTPVVAEGNLINLALRPEVIDLVAYDTYEVTPSNASMLIWSGADTTEMSVVGRYPVPNVPGLDTAWNIMSATLGGDDPNDTAANAHYVENYVGNPNNGFNVQETTIAEGYYDQRRRVRHNEYGVAIPQLRGALPVFRVRKIDTNMTVADGSTVGMGGLIYDKLETYKDKVPVLGSIPLLGRLFRSEGERSVKRNLMIFVTATQVDVKGRRSVDLATR